MRRILVVDDSAHIRNHISEIFTLMGFDVFVAGSGNEALDLFFNHSFDLVISDLEMPNMNGWILASHINDISPDTPIVLITGLEESAVMEGLKTCNVDSVLFKPFSLKDIQDAVQTAIARKTIESGNG
jgi:CheY-like chemotaxis protein